MKVDIGIHINGRIVDSAFAVAFDPMYDNFLAAVKGACHTGVRESGIDASLGELGAYIRRPRTPQLEVLQPRFMGHQTASHTSLSISDTNCSTNETARSMTFVARCSRARDSVKVQPMPTKCLLVCIQHGKP